MYGEYEYKNPFMSDLMSSFNPLYTISVCLYNFVFLLCTDRYIILSSYDQYLCIVISCRKHSGIGRGRKEKSNSLQISEHLALWTGESTNHSFMHIYLRYLLI